MIKKLPSHPSASLLEDDPELEPVFQAGRRVKWQLDLFKKRIQKFKVESARIFVHLQRLFPIKTRSELKFLENNYFVINEPIDQFIMWHLKQGNFEILDKITPALWIMTNGRKANFKIWDEQFDDLQAYQGHSETYMGYIDENLDWHFMSVEDYGSDDYIPSIPRQQLMSWTSTADMLENPFFSHFLSREILDATVPLNDAEEESE